MLTSAAGVHTLPFYSQLPLGHICWRSAQTQTPAQVITGWVQTCTSQKLSTRQMGRKRKLAWGRLRADCPSYSSGPQVDRSAVRDPMSKEIRANLGPLSLDPHPDGSSPDWDIRQWPGTERHGPVRWGSVKREPGVRDPAKQMRSEQDSNT